MIKEIKDLDLQEDTEAFIAVYLISKTNALSNSYEYRYYNEFLKILCHSFLLIKSSNSLSGDDIKLSERLFIHTG